MDVETYVENTKRLLALEKEAETNELQESTSKLTLKELQEKGHCLLDLVVNSVGASLTGRRTVELKKRFGVLPGGLSAGDLLHYTSGKGSRPAHPMHSATVIRRTEASIKIMLDEEEFEEGSTYNLFKAPDEVTLARYLQGLELLPSHPLLPVLLERSPPRLQQAAPFQPFNTSLNPSQPPFQPFNPSLNPSQLAAVRLALAADLALVHGPPGTGKSTTLLEIVLQLVASGLKVLVCAPSNIAVDNLVEGLSGRARIVRVGHPARLAPAVLPHCLDELLLATPQHALLRDVQKELALERRRLDKAKGFDRRVHRIEIAALRKELKERERRQVDEVLTGAQVVLTTTAGAFSRSLRAHHFDVAVVDEAAQALEIAALLPALKSNRLILAGDHHQLPPVITSQEAEAGGLGRTLLDRLARAYPSAVAMLRVQYRMNAEIMQFSSREFYNSLLEADPTVATRVLADLPHIQPTDLTRAPISFLDTAGFEMWEEGGEGTSKANPGEAYQVARLVEEFRAAGVSTQDIGVITPYSAQAALVRARVEVEVASVDAFQGREKAVIILSLVRSNTLGQLGFLVEPRRLNVALTRAQCHVAVVGDSATLTNDPFLKRLCQYLQESGLQLVPYQSEEEEALEGSSALPSKKGKTRQELRKEKKQRKEEAGKKTKTPLAKIEEKGVGVIANAEERERKGKEEPATEKEEMGSRGEIATQRENTEKDKDEETAKEPKGEELEKKVKIEEIVEEKTEEVAKDEEKGVATEDREEATEEENETSPGANMVQNAGKVSATKKKGNAKSKPKAKGKGKGKKPKEEEKEEDEEELLARMDSRKCYKCREDLRLIARACQTCHFNFCFKCYSPELHGCTATAKKPSVRPSDHAKAQAKLHKKLNDEAISRKGKDAKPKGNKK